VVKTISAHSAIEPGSVDAIALDRLGVAEVESAVRRPA